MTEVYMFRAHGRLIPSFKWRVTERKRTRKFNFWRTI